MKIYIYCRNERAVTQHTHILKQTYICQSCGSPNSGRGKRIEKAPDEKGKRGRKPALSEIGMHEAYRMHREGMSDGKIAKRLRVCVPTVRKAWKKMEEENGHA